MGSRHAWHLTLPKISKHNQILNTLRPPLQEAHAGAALRHPHRARAARPHGLRADRQRQNGRVHLPHRAQHAQCQYAPLSHPASAPLRMHASDAGPCNPPTAQPAPLCACMHQMPAPPSRLRSTSAVPTLCCSHFLPAWYPCIERWPLRNFHGVHACVPGGPLLAAALANLLVQQSALNEGKPAKAFAQAGCATEDVMRMHACKPMDLLPMLRRGRGAREGVRNILPAATYC